MSASKKDVIVACDKFKGSLSASQVAEVITRAIYDIDADTVVHSFIIADGGDGTLDALKNAGMSSFAITVAGPTGQSHQSSFLYDGKTAVVELADTCGLVHLPDGKLEPEKSSSYGLGQAIAYALEKKPQTLIIGVGGSASSDGGLGMLQALGAKAYDSNGTNVVARGDSLSDIKQIDLRGLHPAIASTKIILASDVDNVLLGENGAVSVYGAQKGATGDIAQRLEQGLSQWSKLIDEQIGVPVSTYRGAGAAGGVGYAAMAILGATMRPGIELVLELSGFHEHLDTCGLIVTGEGRIDKQTLMGKAVGGVTKAAARYDIPIVAVCGRNDLSTEQQRQLGVTTIFSISEKEPDIDKAIADAATYLYDLCYENLDPYLHT